MKQFLAEVNAELKKRGAPIINKAGCDFLTHLVENKMGGIENGRFCGIYLNDGLPPQKANNIWSAKDDSGFVIEVHVSSCIVCAYCNKDDIGTFCF